LSDERLRADAVPLAYIGHMPPDSIRTFLAIEVCDETRRGLERFATDMSRRLPGFKWTKSEQLHLTLAFLGDVDSTRIDEVVEAVSEVTRSQHAFDVHWQGIGAFPKSNRASILWAGVSAGAQSLLELQRPIAAALAQTGFDVDDRFIPHITLARAKRFGGRPADLRALIDQHRQTEFGHDRVSEIVVMKSDMLPNGSVYTRLTTIPLGSE
jgi:2'-5' RNA ligase